MMDILSHLGLNINAASRLCTAFYDCTIPSVVDQREIQALGGNCREHPASCFMRILFEVLEIENASVLDLTFGVGEFYMFLPDLHITAFDIVDWRKKGYRFAREPDVFYYVSFVHAPKVLYDKKFDVVVFDPPYDVHAASKRNARLKPWLYYGRENLPLLIKHFPRIAKRFATKFVIAKFMDGRGITVFDLVHEFGRKPDYVIIYRFLHSDRPKTSNRILKTHSYFLIWKMSP